MRHPGSTPSNIDQFSLTFHSSQLRRLILDREIRPRRTLVLVPDKIRDLLVLGLLHGGLIVLRALPERVLLDGVDACGVRHPNVSRPILSIFRLGRGEEWEWEISVDLCQENPRPFRSRDRRLQRC